MPGRACRSPANEPGSHAQCAGFRHCGCAKALVERREARPRQRANQKMQADCGGDEDDRPAVRFADDAQEYGRAVEAGSPTEHGEHEPRLDHPPSIESARPIPARHR